MIVIDKMRQNRTQRWWKFTNYFRIINCKNISICSVQRSRRNSKLTITVTLTSIKILVSILKSIIKLHYKRYHLFKFSLAMTICCRSLGFVIQWKHSHVGKMIKCRIESSWFKSLSSQFIFLLREFNVMRVICL